MKIKEVSAGVKVSKNYNSYSINLVADLENGECYENVGNVLIEKAEELIDKKIGNKNQKETEVGAAWFSKDSLDKLSVQYSKGGVFREIEIKDLKKTEEGFTQIVNGDKFVFRNIPEKNRKNNKMPVFRIYKEVKNE